MAAISSRTMPRAARAAGAFLIVAALGSGCAIASPADTGNPAVEAGVPPTAPVTSAAAPTSLAASPSISAAATAPAVASPSSKPAFTASAQQMPDLTISSVVNFRDVAGTGAGLPLANGGHMVRGLVYRSAALGTMSKADQAKLASAGLTDIYDLRTPGVAASSPDPQIGSAKNHLINLYATANSKPAPGSTAEQRLVSRVELNREFVTDPAERGRLAVLLNSFATVKGPVIVHCSEGKDRSGFVAAVLQLIAGVDQPTILTQYLLSNDARKQLIDTAVAKVNASKGAAAAAQDRIDMTVYPQQMQASLDAISAYGGIDQFLAKGVGLSKTTITKIRDKLQGP